MLKQLNSLQLCAYDVSACFFQSVLSVAVESDAGQYNCTFTLSTNLGRRTVTESIKISGMSSLMFIDR